MIEQTSIIFSLRSVAIIDLPLAKNTSLLHPELVMLKTHSSIHDVGALCYTLRSNKSRKPNAAREVVLTSLRKERIKHIRQLILSCSNFIEGGIRILTVKSYIDSFKVFMDWVDTNGFSDCLEQEVSIRQAYGDFARYVEEQFRRHEFEARNAVQYQSNVLRVLEAITGHSDLGKGVRSIGRYRNRDGTEPVLENEFAHALALNNSIFYGFSDLVLNNKPFPFKLSMPNSLGWVNDFLWIFPTPIWSLPPNCRMVEAGKSEKPNRIYDYEYGRISTVDEIWHLYAPPTEKSKRRRASVYVSNATEGLKKANQNPHDFYRRMLAMSAHNAFYFLFLANTSANAAPVAEIETDGALKESTSNAGYRTIKWRAKGKEVDVIVPVAFMPTLRRFMELRQYLLNGKEFPYLFMSLGQGKRDSLAKISEACLQSHYKMLQRIDPNISRMGSIKIRATALAWYRRERDAAISAAVGQHTEKTANAHYDAGTEANQQVEITLLMEKIAQKAEQRVVAEESASKEARLLEEGGACESYGNPGAMTCDVPVKPNCKTGCIFCNKRVLIASEGDARKVASAAYLMEQLIMGPMSEAEFRPKIVKCDEDLQKIRDFDGCAEMVDRVKQDVYENGNLTPYFSQKYQLFLMLGVL